MIFNSLTYLCFFLCFLLLYWGLSNRAKIWLIFGSSLLFYGFWKFSFVPLMLLSAFIDYFVSLKLPDLEEGRKKKWLILALSVNLGLLFVFKYLIFVSETAVGWASYLDISIDPIAMNIILPLGISFYTFQTISYTVDVYRGVIEPERDFLVYASYVTFFPQLIAGPVLRASEVVYQLKRKPQFNQDDLIDGFFRILQGLFLKVALADNIASFVNEGFSVPVSELSGIDVWTLAFLFGFQIYFDFSAYSHIAIGSAKCLGINFPENFNFPYVARSPRDFWQRWHISLSSWIRDYLYLPLAGIGAQNKSEGGIGEISTFTKRNKALFWSWALMGLWHGAAWTFVLWGIYHATVIFIYRKIRGLFENVSFWNKQTVAISITLPVMMLGWVPFRAESLEQTFTMWTKAINPFDFFYLGMRENTYLVAFLITILFFANYWSRVALQRIQGRKGLRQIEIPLSCLYYGILMAIVVVFLRPVHQFIYFQF
jgi:alginate O-acetyltransferase complex protein AlgI